MKLKVKVYAALVEDVNQGWVWLSDVGLPHRSVAKISTPGCKNGKHCEVLTIDSNFINAYNDRAHTRELDAGPALVASEWYRKQPRVTKGEFAEIDIVAANRTLGRFWACWDHPQIVIHFATLLGVWGFILGALGLILSFVGLF